MTASTNEWSSSTRSHMVSHSEHLVEGDRVEVALFDQFGDLVEQAEYGGMICVPEHDCAWLQVLAGMCEEGFGRDLFPVAERTAPQYRVAVSEVGCDPVDVLIVQTVGWPVVGLGADAEHVLHPLVVAFEFRADLRVVQR